MINGIDKDVYYYVNQELDKLEEEFNIKILYAVETGSRGWGFANDDSDYDVRFYYIRPLEYYLSINKNRNVIDVHDLGHRNYKYDLDLSGWDIVKVLELHRKSNPSLREHMIHDMVYRGDCSFLQGLPDFDLTTLKHHYGSMTYNNYMKYIKGKRTDDFSPRVVKTYCYCIRQILAWLLIDEYNDVEAPINIDVLLSRFEDDEILAPQLLQDMRDCIDYYKSGCKLNRLTERAIMNLSTWIDTYLQVIKTQQGKSRELPDMEIYNQRFRDILVQTMPYGRKSDYWDRCHNCEYDNSFPSCTWCDKGYYDGLDSFILKEHYCEDFEPKKIYKFTKIKIGL